MPRNADPARIFALAVVLAATLYTAALCFVNTHVAGVTNSLMAGVDAAIVLMALAIALHGAPRALWALLLALAVNFLTIAFFSDAFSLKAVRDPLVLTAFAALGVRIGGAAAATTAFLLAAAVVVPIALLEYFAPALFTRLFDVLGFYMSRGAVTADDAQFQTSLFFISGERDNGRFLAPFMGSHRVSSIFLEPVSMGNFGALAAALALSLDLRRRWRTALALALVATFAMVMADARFAAGVVVLFAIARFLPLAWTRAGLAILPFAAVAILIAVSAAVSESGDTFATRLALSGNVLMELDGAALLGLAPFSTSTVDSGYAYALTSFGLPLCLLLWAAYVAMPAPTDEAARFKVLLGIYVVSLLCVSGTSLFALKTAALGWFALGALAAAPRPVIRSVRDFGMHAGAATA